MDPDQAQRQAALRARADEAMAAALAAADSRAPIPRLVAETALGAVRLACWDESLRPRQRLALIEESMALLAALKEFAAAPEASRPQRALAILRGTNDLLRRYAGLRPRAGSPDVLE